MLERDGNLRRGFSEAADFLALGAVFFAGGMTMSLG